MKRFTISNDGVEHLPKEAAKTTKDLTDLTDSDRILHASDEEPNERYIDDLAIKFNPHYVSWTLEDNLSFLCVNLDEEKVDSEKIEDNRLT